MTNFDIRPTTKCYETEKIKTNTDTSSSMEIRQYHILNRLAETQSNLRALIDYNERGKKSIELKVQDWATPFGVLPLAIYADKLNMDITYGRNKTKVRSYLRNIYFPRGASNLRYLRNSTYLPLSRLPIDTGDEYLSRYEDLILSNIKDEEVRTSFRNALKYLTSEMVTNIKEHAQTDHYWIMSQYWPTSKACEIAIADTGIGYRDSYKGTPYEVATHEDAIKNAVQGNSSKDDVERGAGIPGLIKIFCEGYGGSVVLLSGDKLLYMEGHKNDFYDLSIDWEGVFIGIRFELKVINALAYLA